MHESLKKNTSGVQLPYQAMTSKICGKETLTSKYPRLFLLSEKKNGVLVDMGGGLKGSGVGSYIGGEKDLNGKRRWRKIYSKT